MELDIDTDDIRSKMDPVRQSILKLHGEGHKLKNELEQRKKERTLLGEEMGWREKYFGGGLGGNKEVVEKSRALTKKINQLRFGLKESNRKLKPEAERLHQMVIAYLNEHSVTYSNLLRESIQHSQLYQASLAYYNLLSAAKKKVEDALIFSSWETLLNHPQAQAGLSQFLEETRRYQQIIDSYERILKVDITGGEKLENYIRFSSQDLAMSGFEKLLTFAENKLSHSEKLFGAKRTQAEAMATQTKKLILDGRRAF